MSDDLGGGLGSRVERALLEGKYYVVVFPEAICVVGVAVITYAAGVLGPYEVVGVYGAYGFTLRKFLVFRYISLSKL